MSLLKVDVNTNSIPASILVPFPHQYPSGGGGGGATIIKVAPVGPAIADAGAIATGAIPPSTLDLINLNLNLLGGKKLLIASSFEVRFANNPGAGYTAKGTYTIKGLLNEAEFGDVPYSTEGPVGFYGLTNTGAAGVTPCGIRLLNQMYWEKNDDLIQSPLILTPILGYGSFLEFESIP